MEKFYPNRPEAGRELAERLTAYTEWPGAIVLGLPRGGVPVAFEVAKRLKLPLDVLIVRKLGVPGFEELAMGAIASGGTRVINPQVVAHLRDPEAMIAVATQRENLELERREREYRDGRPAPPLRGRLAILVDDGLATGATMRAAVHALRQQQVEKIVVAVPVGAPETCQQLAQEADELVCLMEPGDFQAVGHYYRDFSQTSDEEVRQLLTDAAR
jgi:putative phosphoribosyl transferase